MQSKKIIMATCVILLASIETAESAPKSVDLRNLYERFEKAGYSSLDLMDKTKRVTITGVTLDIGQSFVGDSILKVGTLANSKELARLAPADNAQDNKLRALEIGGKFSAVCDLGFSSGTQYMSFQGCVFK